MFLVVKDEMFQVAEFIFNKNFHPTVNYQAHNSASEDVVVVFDKIAMPIDVKGRSTMLKTMKSCIGTKFARQIGGVIAALVIEVVDLDQELQQAGNKRYTIVSIKRITYALENVGVFVTRVEQLTCLPQMLDGRVKMLHSIIQGGILGRKDQHHMAKSMFDERLSTYGVTPDVYIFNILIRGFCKNSMVDEAFKFFKLMEQFKCDTNVVIYNTIVDGLFRERKVGIAHKVVKGMSKKGLDLNPNVVAYTTLVRGYCMKQDIDEALVVFQEMISRGLKPNRITYNTLIKGSLRCISMIR